MVIKRNLLVYLLDVFSMGFLKVNIPVNSQIKWLAMHAVKHCKV